MRDTTALGTRVEVADYLKVPRSTLDQWAYHGTGPAFVKIGRHARYRWSDVDAWVAQQAKGGAAA